MRSHSHGGGPFLLWIFFRKIRSGLGKQGNQSMYSRPVVAVFSLLLVVGLVGCTPTPPAVKTVPASGTVTLNGAPVSGALVTFFAEAGRNSGGQTGSDGRFKLETSLGGDKMADGAPAGTYKVTIVKSKGATVPSGAPDPKSMEGLSDAERAAKMKELTGLGQSSDTQAGRPGDADASKATTLPEKYSDVKTSGLTATVKAGDKNEFTFDLTE
jgi:hypothetical protein